MGQRWMGGWLVTRCLLHVASRRNIDPLCPWLRRRAVSPPRPAASNLPACTPDLTLPLPPPPQFKPAWPVQVLALAQNVPLVYPVDMNGFLRFIGQMISYPGNVSINL